MSARDRSRRVTLESLDQKLDDLKELLTIHTADDTRRFDEMKKDIEPLKRFKNYTHGAIWIAGAMLSFLGWDYIRRLFVIQVIKP